MQFSLIASLIAIAMSAAPALATDYRELYNIPGGDGVAFCKTWKCDCINYTPTSAITFQGAYCEPGNYQGKNTTMQALAYCTFASSSGKVQTVNKHIAAETGATVAP